MRLLIHVEGQTEETFVNEVLSPHLLSVGYTSVGARLLGNARLKRNRGGIRSWPVVRNDIVSHLRNDTGCVATMMVDYYGLPSEGDGAWPGRDGTAHLPAAQRAKVLEQALKADVALAMGTSFNANRFLPFVMMYEFEGLLFSDPGAFARGIGKPGLQSEFQDIRDLFPTPEDINDSPITAPSKRVEQQMPEYEKPLFGTLAVLEIGLPRIRGECPHFAEWLSSLEALAPL